MRLALGESEYTQEALAREVGVTLRSVSKWANGEAEPKGRQLVALAAALGRDASWFYEQPEDEAA